jgi:hypothetical protein
MYFEFGFTKDWKCHLGGEVGNECRVFGGEIVGSGHSKTKTDVAEK